MPCLYPFYAETFFAAGAALRRNDDEWLATIRADAETLEGRRAWAAELAMSDATTGTPLRARIGVCSAFASETCTAGRCPNPGGADLLT